MTSFLVTGPTGFLGYHVVKLLNERGVRPRVLLPRDLDETEPRDKSLAGLDSEHCRVDVADPASLQAACAGIDVVLHLDFAISLGAGDAVERTLYEGNAVATERLVDACAQAGVKRVVVSSSALAVGLSHTATPLDEAADWTHTAFNLPYARSRRDAEVRALARNSADMEVLAVNPSFTMGPEDFVGAPANGLVSRMTSKWFRIDPAFGFSVLDVRDYAAGVLGAAERGRPGTRYLLSGVNLDARELYRVVAAASGLKPPGWHVPVTRWVARLILAVSGLRSRLQGKPPAVSPALLELFGRYAWYDTRRAQEDFGWQPRPLHDTVRDTLAWMRRQAAADS